MLVQMGFLHVNTAESRFALFKRGGVYAQGGSITCLAMPHPSRHSRA